MGLVIENVSGGTLDIDDLGFGLASNGSVDLVLEADALAVAASGNGGDLNTMIAAGDIVVKDPLDDITNLSVTEALLAVRTHNDTHYRMPSGGRIADAIDVDLSSPGSYLQYTGSNFVRQTPGQLAEAIESELDITNLTNYVPNQNIDWTVDQGATTINVGNLPTIDHSTLSNLTTGDPHTQYVKKTGDTMTTGPLNISNNSFIEFQPGAGDLLMRGTSDIIFASSGGLVVTGTGIIESSFGTETNPSFSFNLDENTGIYRDSNNVLGITSGGSTSALFGNARTTLNNELRLTSFPNSRDDGNTTKALYVAANGDIQYGNVASSITIQDEGTPVTGGPHSTLNFVGPGVTATDSVAGTTTITIDGGDSTSVGGVAKRMNTWTLLADDMYYNDFAHSLDTTNIAIHLREFADNRQIEAEYTEILDDNTVRVVVCGNVEDIVCNVVSGSGPQGIEGPPGPGAALTIQDNGVTLTADVAQINFTGNGVTVTEPGTDQIQVSISGGISDVVSDTTPQLGGVLDMNAFGILAGAATISPTEVSRLDGVTSNVQTQLNAKTTATGHTHVYRVPHTWGISGPIQVPVGQTGFILPMFVSFAPGQSAALVKCRYRINDGTSVTFKLQRNGVDVPGFTNMSATTTSTNTDPVDVTLTDDDQLALVVTAVNGAPQNLSMTMFIEYTQ